MEINLPVPDINDRIEMTKAKIESIFIMVDRRKRIERFPFLHNKVYQCNNIIS